MSGQALEEVLRVRKRGPAPPGEVEITGEDPTLSTRFRIGETCAAVLAGVGIAVSDLWELRTGRRQRISIDVRHACAALTSTRHLQRPDDRGTFRALVNEEHRAMQRMTQPWPTRDGRWFLPHFGLPNLRARVLDVLGCAPDPQSVRDAVASWDALALEAAIDEARACGAMVRSNAEWMSHDHGRELARRPIVEITKIADSDPEPLPEAVRPLGGLRVLDLTRILAGPIAARTLAEHGAHVLMITSPDLPQIPEHVIDTSHGKRSAYLDLETQAGAGRLTELVRSADVFCQGYRPGALEARGFGPLALADLRPGLVYVSISCFGNGGPFSHRAGWEQVAQTVTGICHEGSPQRPVLLPAAACDYTTGYLAAYGTLLALARRARDGGSYHVQVSLCQSGMFIYRQGKTHDGGEGIGLSDLEVEDLRVESPTAQGPLRHLGPVLSLSETRPRWDRPTPVLGADTAAWASAA